MSYPDGHNVENYMMIRCGRCGTRYSSSNLGCPICTDAKVRSPVIEDKGAWL